MWSILINAQSSGKVSTRTIEGREHIVTQMMPIMGDTVMNSIFYPDDELQKSYLQLNNLPAPAGHPKLGGQYVPANHPVANNKHNIGGFIQNPRKEGKSVLVDFLLDIEVANSTKKGRELIEKINNGEKVGVSTGLTVSLTNAEHEDYKAIASDFRFDHVSILFDEVAAGAHVGTELILNESNEVPESGELVCNASFKFETNELSAYQIRDKIESLLGGETWVIDIYPQSNKVIYRNLDNDKTFSQNYALLENDQVSLVGEVFEVIEKREFVPVGNNSNHEGDEMDKKTLILAIIANSKAHTGADFDALMALDEAQLAAELTKAQVANADEAALAEKLESKGFTILNQATKAEFDQFLAGKEQAKNEVIEKIVANSEFKAEELQGKSVAELEKLAALATRSTSDFSMRNSQEKDEENKTYTY